MPQTHDLGRLFFHTAKLRPDTARVHRAVTNELDYPYRQSRSLVLRVKGSKGLVIGWWHDTGRTDDEALQDALSAGLGTEDLPDVEETEADHWRNRISDYRPPLTPEVAQEVLEAAKRTVAEHALSVEEEHEFLNMLGF